MLAEFLRIKRKLPRFVRNRLAFLGGAFYAAIQIFRGNLKGLKDHLQKEAESIHREITSITEADDRVIFLFVGQAITAWAKLEEALVFLFSLLIRTEVEKAGLILYSTINFSVWISMIDDLLAVDDSLNSFKPRWNKLAARLRALKDQRDRIAHHGADRPSTVLPEMTIRPSRMDIRQKVQKYKPMDTEDILLFSKHVGELTEEITQLVRKMLPILKASLEKSAE